MSEDRTELYSFQVNPSNRKADKELEIDSQSPNKQIEMKLEQEHNE